ncbi:hypothetical protein CP533_5349 [Ophiocordyceps camponoti-saundersi (nom. inval.)]|nr:hypothetical protein CP533_5349 [Ophiocordyceps camponoti-saundersi (nom. inval.)]
MEARGLNHGRLSLHFRAEAFLATAVDEQHVQSEPSLAFRILSTSRDGKYLYGVTQTVMPGTRGFGAARLRSLPLFTRAIIVVIIVFWAAGLPSAWKVRDWAALVPDRVSLKKAYRLSTFPLVHLNVIHAALNVAALTPLMERFENEHGTLTTLSLFFGREDKTFGCFWLVADLSSALTTLPAILYLVIERGILRSNNAVAGASVWVFLLLGVEAIRTYRTDPHLIIGGYHFPTWITPLLMIFVVAVLIPNTSLLGHLCGALVGYICEMKAASPCVSSGLTADYQLCCQVGLGYLKFLAPPEKALRWIEARLNLLAVLPHYVSVDQKTYGRFGILPSSNRSGSAVTEIVGGTQRVGPRAAS